MGTLRQRLSYLILGQKGGQNRIQIVELLNDRPYNLNQLAEILKLNYRTIKHHIDVMLKNEIVSSSHTGSYGEVYFLTPEMEGNFAIFEDLVTKFNTSKKLEDFTKSPKFFQNVMEQTNDAVIIINNDEEIFFWNESAEKLFGYDKEEVKGEKIQIFSNLKTFKSTINKVKKGEIIVDFETKGRHSSGKLFDISNTINRIYDENEKLIGLSIIARDISDRKKAEEELRYSEQRYALAQRAANIGSWDWDILTNELTWSETIEPMFGFSPGKFGRTYDAFLDCVHPEDRQFVIDSVNASVEKGENYDIEHRIIWPDGTIRTVSEIGNVFRDSKGKAIRMVGVVQDITSRKNAEKRIKNLNNLLSKIKDINVLVNRETEIHNLIQKSCEKLFETKDYMDISIAILDEKTGLISPMGHSGKHERIEWEISPKGKGKAPKCIKSVLKSRLNVTVQRTKMKCKSCKFCKHGKGHQTILIPMLEQRTIIGIMTVCFEADHEVEDYELELLDEVAKTLAFSFSKLKTEAALLTSEEKYRAAFNTSPDLFYRVSVDGKILDCNDTVIKTLGYSKDELIGMPLFNIYTEESKPYAKECFKEWQKTGKLRNKKLTIAAKNGKKFNIDLNVNTIYDKDGNIMSSISSQRIIDEH